MKKVMKEIENKEIALEEVSTSKIYGCMFNCRVPSIAVRVHDGYVWVQCYGTPSEECYIGKRRVHPTLNELIEEVVNACYNKGHVYEFDSALELFKWAEEQREIKKRIIT